MSELKPSIVSKSKLSQDQLNIDDAQREDENECWDDARQLVEELNLDDNSMRDSNQLISSSALSSSQTNDICSSGKEAEFLIVDSLILHEAVFNNDANTIYQILKDKESAKLIINKKDKHGNTALHLACMLGRSKEIVSALLQCGAGVEIKNLNRWTPFHEACSYGDREVIRLMTKRLQEHINEALCKNTSLSGILEKMRSYRLVLKWEFESWVPFLARILPNDTCVINKQGSSIRIDTSLLDIEMKIWKRGECSLIYSKEFGNKWIIMNNTTKKYQYFETRNIDRTKDIDRKVDEFMSGDIIDLELKFSDIQLTRSTSGWIWKAEKTGTIGDYNVVYYTFDNLFLVTRKRREHLTEEDVKKNKLMAKFAMAWLKNIRFPEKPHVPPEIEDALDEHDIELKHRVSLPPPPATNVTWEQYCQAAPGEFPNLGRAQKCKETKTAFKASLAMSDQFPITKREFVDLLSIVPLKTFKKLRDFIEMRLPEGFPVRLDVPMFAFLIARVTFEDFAFMDGPINESLFSVPCDYEEDPNLYPFLAGKQRNNGLDT